MSAFLGHGDDAEGVGRMSVAVVPRALTVPERFHLATLEAVVARGLATFVEVGTALLEIRDTRLYRETHPTFEDYCRERWQFSRQRAHQLIQAAEVSTVVDGGLTNEAQARELVPLLPEPWTLHEAWAEAQARAAADGGKVTAELLSEVVFEKRLAASGHGVTGPTPAPQMAVHYSSETDEWETPQDLFATLDAEFDFDLDVCAVPANAKCARYFTPEQDGLAQDWQGSCWMNPPYGSVIGAWVRKAWESAMAGARVVCLVPARVETNWWWDYCRYGEIRFLRGRLRFGGGDTSAPFPSAVVIFRGHPAQVIWWERAAS